MKVGTGGTKRRMEADPSVFEPYRLLVSLRGRIGREAFVLGCLLVLTSAWSVRLLLEMAGFADIGRETLGVRPLSALIGLSALWGLLSLAVKRAHDLDHGGVWLLGLAVPLLGPLWIISSLTFRRGSDVANRFGVRIDREALDYLQMETLPQAGPAVVTEVTHLYPIAVKGVLRPTSVDALVRFVAETSDPICIGGGRFSMGGQTASPGCTHVDMRALNRVLAFSPVARTVRVEGGIRWCDLQRFLDPHDLSVKIMQTYANFTVGGSLSVNVHGRYIGLGPLILSVRAIRLLTADGVLHEATPAVAPDLFFGAIGGYGALGIIVEAELDLADNCRVRRDTKTMDREAYAAHFLAEVRDSEDAIFHNADLYPPHFERLRSVTYRRTDAPTTEPHRLRPVRLAYPLERYFFWAFSETPFGKWRRERIIDPLLTVGRCVLWRNREASYDVRELEPASRDVQTYVLQEYFVPIAAFDAFVPPMGEIFRRHAVNVINVSVRHARPDSGSMLAWARTEVFAFVVYYKQGTDEAARGQVAVWTRELIDLVLSLDGTWYLPYQIHATAAQFAQAYPRHGELFAAKRAHDPHYRFRNALWDAYYPVAAPDEATISEVRRSDAHGDA